MSDALSKAFADAERSYLASKASVADLTGALLSQGPGGIPLQRSDLSRATEQIKHFKGWPFVAIRAIASRIAGQPIRRGYPKKPKRLKADEPTGEALDSHPLLDLLNGPNDLMVAWSLIYVTVASMELTGRQLWWLPKREKIYPIPTSWILSLEGSTEITGFTVRPRLLGEQFSIPAEECCYFCYPDSSDPHGAWSPLQAAAGAVDSDEAMLDSQVSMFLRGIHPPHAIIVGKEPIDGIPGGLRPRLTSVQQRQIISAILKRYEGIGRNEPIILDGLVEDIRKISNSPEEMDWRDSSRITKARILQTFGVTPIIVGEVEGANRAPAAAADRHFCDTCINPKLVLMSQCMTEWLGPMFGDGLWVWIEPAQADDADLRLQRATLLVQGGAISAPELRRLSPFNLPENPALANTLVGGENLNTGNLISRGIGNMVRGEVAGMFADGLLDRIGLTGGNGHEDSVRR